MFYNNIVHHFLFFRCYAHVGFIGGRQVVNIDNGCSTTGIVLHEIGHSIGLHHEQSRPDRNSYVRVYPENIKKGTGLFLLSF